MSPELADDLTGVQSLEPAQADEDLRRNIARLIPDILPYSRTVVCRKQQKFLVPGSRSNHFYYLQQGAIEASYTLRGTRIVVALISEGNFFGVTGFFDRMSRIRDLYATADSIIQVFGEAALQALQNENPALFGRLMTLLIQNVCFKFRRVLEEREPMVGYAAALSAGRRRFKRSRPLPEYFFQTHEWKFVHGIVEAFKAKFFDISHSLQKDYNPEISAELQAQCHQVMDDFNVNLRRMHRAIESPEFLDFVWGYVFKEIFPYFMRSRFAERAYYKPKGYPGDYLMMEMIYMNQAQGDGKFGTIADSWLLKSAPARAVRGRRRLMCEQLHHQSRRRRAGGAPIRIASLACGPCRELFDFLSGCDFTEKIDALCIDIDPDALQYVNNHVNVFHHRAAIRFLNENLVKWALGRARQDFQLQDIIYCVGLADYLETPFLQRLIRRCYQQLHPGGTLILGNFGAQNPDRAFMEHILSWHLIHRSADDLAGIFGQTPFGDGIEIIAEEQHINLFAVAHKPEDAPAVE
jgi:CRP-like cAMP-binding protein/SAM-dependent methyltransferase